VCESSNPVLAGAGITLVIWPAAWDFAHNLFIQQHPAAREGENLKFLPKSVVRHEQSFCLLRFACLLTLLALAPTLHAQADDSERPVPILTGSAGFNTSVVNGQTALSPNVSPLLLLPLGDKWLIEAKGYFSGNFRNPNGDGFQGVVQKGVAYVQADYIANRYVTFTVGRFVTPFGIYNERIYPNWIRDLQQTPLIYPIGTGASDGAMLRGGFSLNPKVELNYATYFSTNSSVNKFQSDRMVGGRAGLFFPGPRVEIGASWQKALQEERGNGFGFHFAWQPLPIPLNLRSEYARSNLGSGYWIEGAYRLSQAHHWEKALRHTELVVRAQQLFAGSADEDDLEEYGLPDVNVRQGDFGINYYLRDGLRASASYGRQFSSDGDFNVWTVGIAYRFAIPLGRVR
jgi:hypothetical protein